MGQSDVSDEYFLSIFLPPASAGFLLGLVFDPTDEDIFLPNFC
jgi:hypothetical protein